MARAKANGIEIEYETFGNRADPAMLLIMGLGAQLTLWPRAFCEGLAGKGYFVVRYDNMRPAHRLPLFAVNPLQYRGVSDPDAFSTFHGPL